MSNSPNGISNLVASLSQENLENLEKWFTDSLEGLLAAKQKDDSIELPTAEEAQEFFVNAAEEAIENALSAWEVE